MPIVRLGEIQISDNLQREDRCLACPLCSSRRGYRIVYTYTKCRGLPYRNTMAFKTKKICPKCGVEIEAYLNPLPTVDIIIELHGKGIILIKRKNFPMGWAMPGGFVDYGESLEDAAIREAKEETGLDVKLISQLHTYSKPERDPRHHAISTVYIAKARGNPSAADDAAEVGIFTSDNLPSPIVFDHKEILADYFKLKKK